MKCNPSALHTVLLFELGVGLRRDFMEMGKTEVEDESYVKSALKNDSEIGPELFPSDFRPFINVPVLVFSTGRMAEGELPLSSPG